MQWIIKLNHFSQFWRKNENPGISWFKGKLYNYLMRVRNERLQYNSLYAWMMFYIVFNSTSIIAGRFIGNFLVLPVLFILTLIHQPFPSYICFLKPMQQRAIWKHSDKRRNCSERAISPFDTMFSTFSRRLSIQL